MDNTDNKKGEIILLIFLLVCAGLGITAFVMAMTKCKKDGFADGICCDVCKNDDCNWDGLGGDDFCNIKANCVRPKDEQGCGGKWCFEEKGGKCCYPEKKPTKCLPNCGQTDSEFCKSSQYNCEHGSCTGTWCPPEAPGKCCYPDVPGGPVGPVKCDDACKKTKHPFCNTKSNCEHSCGGKWCSSGAGKESFK